MPAPLAVAAAAAGRAAASKAAQAAGTRAAQGVASRGATQAVGKPPLSGPAALEGRGSEFFKTERTLEDNISRRLDAARKEKWGRGRSSPSTSSTQSTSNDGEDSWAEAAQLEEEEKRAFSGIEKLYSEQGEKLTSEEAARLRIETPKTKPSLPILIFALALIKDFLDVPLDLTLVAAIFATILSIFVSLSIALWMIGKMGGAWYKRGMIKWFWRRFVLVALIEFIPGLQLIPANIALVWMAHNREKKAVQLLNNSLEILHGKGFGPQR